MFTRFKKWVLTGILMVCIVIMGILAASGLTATPPVGAVYLFLAAAVVTIVIHFLFYYEDK